jgi:hypothetical protein
MSLHPIFNINNDQKEYIDNADFVAPLNSVLIGDAAGSEKFM